MKGWGRCLALSVWIAAAFPALAPPLEQSPGATLQQARRLVEDGEWSQAEAVFAELEKKGLLRAENLEEAVEPSRRLNHWERVIALYRLFPLDANQRLKLYEACLRAGRPSEAEAELKKLQAERPDDEQLIHLLAFLYLSQNRTRQAVALYQRFLSGHPQALQSQINLALVHFSLEETAAAMDRLGRAYRSDADEANRYLYRQVVRNMSGMRPDELARLIADIRQELGLAAEGAESWRILAQEYRNLNRYAPAIAAYRAYLDQKEGEDKKALYELARLHFLQGDDHQAEATLAPLLRASGPQGDQARLFAAELAVKGGDFEQAQQLLDELPSRYASQGIFRYLSARIALEQGETERARQLLEEVTRSHPEIAQALLHLGRLYMQLGRREEGRRLLSQFRQLSQQARQ